MQSTARDCRLAAQRFPHCSGYSSVPFSCVSIIGKCGGIVKRKTRKIFLKFVKNAAHSAAAAHLRATFYNAVLAKLTFPRDEKAALGQLLLDGVENLLAVRRNGVIMIPARDVLGIK